MLFACRLLDLALVAIVAYHLLVSPYTKVEELFTLQAVHDILKYGVFSVGDYDHVQFPGAVPRSFVGALALATVTRPFLWVADLFGVDLSSPTQLYVQLLVRALLGLANVWALTRLRNAINKVSLRDKSAKNGVRGLVGFWFSVLILSQFHLLYYASRTLPNMVVLPVVTYALGRIILGDFRGLVLLGAAGAVFRLEVGLFGGLILLVSSLVYRQSDLVQNTFFLAAGAAAGFALSLAVDSYFWNRWVVPEVASFIFNVVEGHSAQWGVEPWQNYFTKYLPKLFRPPVVLVLLLPGFLTDPADDGVYKLEENGKRVNVVRHPARHGLHTVFVASVLFVVAMSFQPHKEWRFIVYVVPIWTLQAANGLANINMKWAFSFTNKVLLAIVVILSAAGTVLSLFSGYASSFNYPGGAAIDFANNYVLANHNGLAFVYMDVAACMSGISRFTELQNTSVVYDKTEDKAALLGLWNNITIYVGERQETDSLVPYNTKNWRIVEIVPKFDSITILPLAFLAQQQSADRSAIPKFLHQVLKEVQTGNTGTITSLLRSLIVKRDYLYVYERLNPDDILESLLEEYKNKTEELPSVDFVRAMETALLDPDASEFREEINRQVDKLEDAIEEQIKDI